MRFETAQALVNHFHTEFGCFAAGGNAEVVELWQRRLGKVGLSDADAEAVYERFAAQRDRTDKPTLNEFARFCRYSRPKPYRAEEDKPEWEPLSAETRQWVGQMLASWGKRLGGRGRVAEAETESRGQEQLRQAQIMLTENVEDVPEDEIPF